jgi:hypothetical protein
LSLPRAVIGALVAGFIMRAEGWPLYLVVQYFPQEYRYNTIFVLIGIFAGLIAGSSFWGALSSLGSIPVLFVFILSRGDISIDSVFQSFQSSGVERVFFMIAGGIIGGYLSGKLTGKDEYVLLRFRR